MQVPALMAVVEAAVAEGGLVGAAVLDRHGKAIAFAGTFDVDEVRLIAGVVMRHFKSDDLRARLLAGEMMELELDSRALSVGIAAKRAFVVVELGVGVASRTRAVELQNKAARVIREMLASSAPLLGDDGGSSSGPAGLPVIEWGVTVRVKD
ncbi:MAG: hypothetical protein H0T46_37760 [Deltaproteobacteria bacterium]|nr:hypothetical protein [Deltaproteobacteria bacterium]